MDDAVRSALHDRAIPEALIRLLEESNQVVPVALFVSTGKVGYVGVRARGGTGIAVYAQNRRLDLALDPKRTGHYVESEGLDPGRRQGPNWYLRVREEHLSKPATRAAALEAIIAALRRNTAKG